MRNVLLLLVLLLALPAVTALSATTSNAAYVPQTELRTLELWKHMNSGKFVYEIKLDKHQAEAVLDLSASGYGEGKFTLWLEPVNGTQRFVLASSSDLLKKKETLSAITGFATGAVGGKEDKSKGYGKDENPGKDKEHGKGKGKIKVAESNENSESKGISRRRLEKLLHFLQGFTQGLAKKNARDIEYQKQGILTKPVRFRSTCSQTCNMPWPTTTSEYRLVAEVQGKVELHSVQYTILQTPATAQKNR